MWREERIRAQDGTRLAVVVGEMGGREEEEEEEEGRREGDIEEGGRKKKRRVVIVYFQGLVAFPRVFLLQGEGEDGFFATHCAERGAGFNKVENLSCSTIFFPSPPLPLTYPVPHELLPEKLWYLRDTNSAPCSPVLETGPLSRPGSLRSPPF